MKLLSEAGLQLDDFGDGGPDERFEAWLWESSDGPEVRVGVPLTVSCEVWPDADDPFCPMHIPLKDIFAEHFERGYENTGFEHIEKLEEVLRWALAEVQAAKEKRAEMERRREERRKLRQ